ncbi:hypothetical protein [Sorangium atrum]|uniref:Kazal-like domain-containing protein n=1 Tax=Sorangium atrum TaxID=2995308 RepID=A0ABT5BRT4_9BACT|nr:hypothetical protein [Sorangium aterium]MDC0676876.1 hypothetical protein [Sorangium aterium]
MSHARLSSLLFGLSLAACSGTVEIPSSDGGADDFRNLCGGTVDMPSGTGGAGDSGGTASTGDTGGGGAGGSASSTSSGGTPLACGGRSGGICSAEEYCDFPDDSCGTFDTIGRCTPRPGGCPEDCPGVCGCDNQFYCNACAAQQAGVDVSANASCVEPEVGRYTVSYWPGGYDHLTIYKARPEADLCVVLYAEAPSRQSPEGFAIVTVPEVWSVSRILMSKGAASCTPDGQGSAGAAVSATSATGSLTVQTSGSTSFPSTIDVDITVFFPEEPTTDRLRATGLVVGTGEN